MTAIDQIEKELADLRSRFSQAFQVLDDLSQIQTHFEQLTQTQQDLEATLSRAQNTLSASSTPVALQEQYSQLEAKYTQLHSEMLDLRHSFEATTYDLQDQLHQDRNQLNQLGQNATTPSSMDNSKLDWLENSMQDLSNLIYADRSALQHLDRRLNYVKRVTDIITIVGASCLFVITVVLFVTRAQG